MGGGGILNVVSGDVTADPLTSETSIRTKTLLRKLFVQDIKPYSHMFFFVAVKTDWMSCHTAALLLRYAEKHEPRI